MGKMENTKCTNCGFDFKNIPPQSQLYNCDCGKSQADITKEYIRIISEEVKESDSNLILPSVSSFTHPDQVNTLTISLN